MGEPLREYNVYVRHTLAVLRGQGVDLKPLLARLNIDESRLSDEEDQLSRDDYSRLVDEITRHYDVPGLGLLDGAGVNLLDHGLLGYAMFASANLGKALERHSRYQDVIGAVLHTALIIEQQTARLRVVSVARPDMVDSDLKMQYELEKLFTQWAEIGPAIGRDRHWFDSVELTYPAPGHRDMYGEFLGEPVRFKRDYNQLNFPAALLQHRLSFANEKAAQLCERQCAALLADLQKADGLVGEIRRILANSPGQYPTIEEVAGNLAMGERTLRRRLADEGTSYKQVVLEFRMELAAGYLRGREMSIQEIAYVTGYADPSNFHRTFSRYYQATPKAYREQHQTGRP
jgi:AraC-like DNA-binding protein